MRTFRRPIINTDAAFNKWFARICFVIVVISTWSCLLNLQSSKSQVILYRKYSIQHFKKDELLKASFPYEEPNLKSSQITHFLDLGNEQVKSNVSGLVILSSMRSGSSFLGQFFNQNPYIFYFFEPLFPLQYACNKDEDDKIMVLASAFKCNLSEFQHQIKSSIDFFTKMLNDTSKQTDHSQRRLHNLKKCDRLSFCFPSNTKSLYDAPKCANQSFSKCMRSLKKEDIEFQCQSSSLVVVKTVRTCQLSWLKRVQKIVGGQLKVIHLVRDPRAVALSRREMNQLETSIVKDMQMNCNFDQSIFNEHKERFSKNASLHWQAKNYMLIRYEDLLMHPVDSLKFISQGNWSKVNLLHDDVLNWIKKNTKESTGSRYSTSRNRTEQLYKWRKEISMKLTDSIQHVCGDMMNLFGYVSTDSVTELRNISLRLVNPLP